jgi:hypothetical protein
MVGGRSDERWKELMMSEGKFRIGYADVVATLALILALGGTAYAATALPKHSVGTPQLKPEAVTAAKVHDRAITGPKLKPNAVTSDKVANGGISRADIADGAVSTNQVADGSITTIKIGAGEITEDHLFPGSVGSDAVTNESLTLADLAGGQNNPLTAGIGGMDPGFCGTFGALPVPGAEPGQIALAGWLQAPPEGATIASVRVSGQNAVALTVCNVSSAALSVPGGATFRIVTIG